ncbi:MAG: adenylate/guanylate cyclase domain-containing protein [Magnetovibrionaceae bacterium]
MIAAPYIDDDTTAGDLTILFADISGSTHLYEKLGDSAAHDMVSKSIHLLTSATNSFNGRVVKTIGDEIMAVFEIASGALEAAIEMQEGHVSLPLSIKIGFHRGTVIEQDGDVFGDAVNVAARLTSIATKGEIITTEQTIAALPEEHKEKARFLDRAQLRGKDESLAIYQILWETEDETVFEFDGPPETHERQNRSANLLLSGSGHQTELTGGDMPYSIGRRSDNCYRINDVCVSRNHATIKFESGRFRITDHSSRGTIVVFAGETDKPVLLKRETVDLRGAGAFFLGRNPSDPEAIPVHFEVYDS